MGYALIDAQWPAVRRLVRVLCARRLPVTLPGPVVTRLIETTTITMTSTGRRRAAG